MILNKVKEAEAKHYMPVYSRDGLCIDRGEGNCVFDINGNKYVDFAAGDGANILGYGHSEFIAALSAQIGKLIHVSNRFFTEIQSEYIEKLSAATGYDRVFLCNSGSEANECAIKLARKYFYKSGKPMTTLVSEGAYHGETLGAVAATDNAKLRAAYAPIPGGFDTFRFNDFDDFKNKLASNVGAVLIETVQSGSLRPFDNDFLVNAYALCKARGVLLILDETRTCMGRTGKLFAFEHYGIRPDIITLSCAVAGGLPMGACIAAEQVGTAFEIGDHGSTFGGNPLSCAAANATLNILQNELLEKSAAVGEYLGEKLAHFSKYNFIADIRGIGLMRGIEFIDKVPAAMIESLLREQGYLTSVANDNTLVLTPPLTITFEETDGFITALDKVCAATCVL